MDPLQLMMEASRADHACAAQTTDEALQAAIARNRPDLRAALAANPAVHGDLLDWLAGLGSPAVDAALAARGVPGTGGDADPESSDSTSESEGGAEGSGEDSAEEADVEDSAEDPVEESADAESEGEGESVAGEAEDSSGEDSHDETAEESAEGAPEQSADTEPDAESESDSEEDPSAEDSREEGAEEGAGVLTDSEPADAEPEPETEDSAEGAAEESADDEPEGEPEADSDEDSHDETVEDSAEGEPAAEEAGVESEDEGEPAADEAEDSSGEDSHDETVEDSAEGAAEESADDESEGEPEADSDEDSHEADSEEGVEAPADAQPEDEPAADEAEDSSAGDSHDETAEDDADTAVVAAVDPEESDAGESEDESDDDESDDDPPVAPPPSAEDIAAWADTPSGALGYIGDVSPAVYASASSAPQYYDQGQQPYAPAYVAVPQPSPSPQPSSSSSQKHLMVVIVVLLMVIVGGGGAWLGSAYLGDRGDDTASDSQSSAGSDGASSGAEPMPASSVTIDETVQACDTAPTITPTSLSESDQGLQMKATVTTACAEGDFLAGVTDQIMVYGPANVRGDGDPDFLVASGQFDFSSKPLLIPADGVTLTLRFGGQHYYRAAADMNAASLVVTTEPDRSAGTSLEPQGSSITGSVVQAAEQSDAVLAVQEESAAGKALRWYADRDQAVVTSDLSGKWTPQLSSKRPGLYAEGITWDNRSTLQEFLTTRQTNSSARLVYSDDWPVFDPGGGWWVTLEGTAFGSSDAANAWCDTQGYDADHCFAKRMGTSGTPEGTTKLR